LTGLLDGYTAPEENGPMPYHLKHKDILFTPMKCTHYIALSLQNIVPNTGIIGNLSLKIQKVRSKESQYKTKLVCISTAGGKKLILFTLSCPHNAAAHI
jgi:hypothetical protein